MTKPVLDPRARLRSLDRLVGSWDLSGGIRGRIRFEWMEGGFFLVQHFDLEQDGRPIKGIEIIGQRHDLINPVDEIVTRIYSFVDGLTLDCVYELENDNFTVWGGYKGSDACFTAKFSPDGDSFTGGWKLPGGGFPITARRVR